MSFKKGNKFAKGGRRPGAGRKTKTAQEKIRELVEAHAMQIGTKYINRALSKNADRVLCHAVDKLLPSESIEQQRPIHIQFIRFDNGAVVVPSTRISAPILDSDGTRKEAGASMLASPQWKRHLLSELSDNSDVHGDGR